jgi:threonine dehydratase
MSVPCDTICDGVAVPLVVPEIYENAKKLVDEVMLVSEDAVKSAIKRLALHNKLVTEGSAALSVAAALATSPDQRGTTVCIVTGGSIDPDLFVSIITDPAIE